ncbi:hypothetical protein DPMN_065159 [Dreissena polymorpha]|uniref:Uncharacterized protein n=1 Tax=Dreissena polymorpha TaxID=45954 RepID=A0A9D4CF71_DREPO|nr:hypothetical protein DPMN_065159 [Dreissena polymorpha]
MISDIINTTVLNKFNEVQTINKTSRALKRFYYNENCSVSDIIRAKVLTKLHINVLKLHEDWTMNKVRLDNQYWTINKVRLDNQYWTINKVRLDNQYWTINKVRLDNQYWTINKVRLDNQYWTINEPSRDLRRLDWTINVSSRDLRR